MSVPRTGALLERSPSRSSATSLERPSRPRPRRRLFSSPPDLHTGTAVAKFHDERDILQASLPLAYYMLANKWAVQSVLQDAGATEDTFRGAWHESGVRLSQLFGDRTAERIVRLYHEFDKRASGR